MFSGKIRVFTLVSPEALLETTPTTAVRETTFISCMHVIPLYICSCKLSRSELTAVHHSFLENELESCQILLEEEPDNKCELNRTFESLGSKNCPNIFRCVS